MWVGIGVGIGRNRFATGIFNAYALRVTADGGITEAGQCVDAVTGLLLNASLLLIPSGYKGGKLYAEIPTNGNGDLTWTRASNGTRINSSGLVEVCPWNLCTYSEQFQNADWIGGGNGKPTMTDNFAEAPNGTMTASKMEAASDGYQLRQNNAQENTQMNLSVWLRTNTGTKTIQLFMNNASTASQNITVTTTWTRYEISGLVTTLSGGGRNGLNTLEALTSSNYILIWGFQLNVGLTAKPYFPTTDRLNVPRLSYMYGSCPAVLAEPQRTNLLTYSNTPTDSSWSKLGLGAGTAPVVTANAGTSPEGMNNATRVQFNCGGTTSSDRSILQKPSISLINATNYAATIYVKAYSSGEVGKQLRFIQEGVTSQSIITLTDSWQRVAITGTSATTTSNYIIETRGGTTTNTTADVLIYGAQVEAGAYPTTYIPTTSATATRVADSFSRNNIYTNGLISASGGTWFVELRGNVSLVRDAGVNFGLGIFDNAGTNGINVWNVAVAPTSTRLQIRKNIASGGSAIIYTTTTDTCKIAIKWNGTSIDVFENGIKVVSASTFAITNMDFLRCSCEDRPRFIQQMALFPTPLSDTDCAAITSL